jgi:hypothetical protein
MEILTLVFLIKDRFKIKMLWLLNPLIALIKIDNLPHSYCGTHLKIDSIESMNRYFVLIILQKDAHKLSRIHI